jgi:hypothetical protein
MYGSGRERCRVIGKGTKGKRSRGGEITRRRAGETEERVRNTIKMKITVANEDEENEGKQIQERIESVAFSSLRGHLRASHFQAHRMNHPPCHSNSHSSSHHSWIVLFVRPHLHGQWVHV